MLSPPQAETLLSFQFLWGAIKSCSNCKYYNTDVSFNSYEVRLKALHDRCRMHRSEKFQFLWGAIKSAKDVVGSLIDSMFQFLWGAIKSSFVPGVWDYARMFQFLWGAIKRYDLDRITHPRPGFNSYEVRLKGFSTHLQRPWFDVSIPMRCD